MSSKILSSKHLWQDRCLEFLVSRRQELFHGLPILDIINSPYRNRLSEGSSGAFDNEDDDDIPFRRSQESVKLSSSAGSPTRLSLLGFTGSGLVLDTKATAFPPRSSSYQGLSSEEPTPVVYNGPPFPDSISQQGGESQLEYLSAPMSQSQSRSSNISSSTSDDEPYKGSTQVPSTSETPTYVSSHASSSVTADVFPKRTLSQRAKVGSASIAAAVKNLARSRSGSNSYSNNNNNHYSAQSNVPTPLPQLPPTAGLTAPASWQYHTGATSPLRETYSPEVRSATSSDGSNVPVPPLQKSQSATEVSAAGDMDPRSTFQLITKTSVDVLPAGAAPLIGRPPSLTASSPPSALPTPEQGIRGPVDNPLFAEPHTIHSLSLVDPESVYETYHQAEKDKESEDAPKRQAATD